MADLLRLQEELVKLQQWVRDRSQRLVIAVEGRDAAGKGGVIKRITEPSIPDGAGSCALPAPSDRERSQWYFQRYVEHLPAAGEIVVFRPQLVQPGRGRASHGLLHRGGGTEILPSVSRFRTDAP